ncbi:MAG: hypothetical protein V1717_00660 [Candidatus Micrarchaeota archaeon]
MTGLEEVEEFKLPAGVPVVEEKPKLKQKKRGRKKAPRFKLTRFDRDLAELVKNGVSDVPTILQKMAVDPEDFNKRVGRLVRKGYFVFDSQTRSLLTLGWQGYNLFAPAKQNAAEKRKDVEEKAKEEAPRGAEKERVFESPLQPPVQILPAPQSAEDLAELLRKGAAQNPQKSSLFVERQQQKTSQAPAKEERADTGKALILEGKEACELCKAKFKLNVKNTDQAKYGHCFCGAGFHKDCYESLLQNGGACVRCGRKLKLMFDRKAEEAVRGIKDAFE